MVKYNNLILGSKNIIYRTLKSILYMWEGAKKVLKIYLSHICFYNTDIIFKRNLRIPILYYSEISYLYEHSYTNSGMNKIQLKIIKVYF